MLLVILAVLTPLGLSVERAVVHSLAAPETPFIIDEQCPESSTESEPDGEKTGGPNTGPTIPGVPGVLGERGHTHAGLIRWVAYITYGPPATADRPALPDSHPDQLRGSPGTRPWAIEQVARDHRPQAPPVQGIAG